MKLKVDASRCLDTRYPQLVCGACVAACPADALEVNPDQIAVSQSCDGCGLCVPACPEAALALAPAHEWFGDEEKVGLAACDRSAATPTRACVHSLGIRELLDGVAASVHRWMIATGDCSACKRAPRPEARVAEAARRVDAVLRARGARGLTVEVVPARSWLEARRRASPPSEGEERRAFLRRFLRPATASASASASATASASASASARPPPPIAPGLRVPQRTGALAFFAVTIEPAACTACHACARLCPTDALVLETDPDGAPLRYVLRSDACTGCGVCEASCDDAAITVALDEPATDTPILLKTARCATCTEIHAQVATPTPRCRRRPPPPRLLVL